MIGYSAILIIKKKEQPLYGLLLYDKHQWQASMLAMT